MINSYALIDLSRLEFLILGRILIEEPVSITYLK